MPDLSGVDIDNPVRFVALAVVIWVGMYALITVLFGGDLLDGLVPKLFGGLLFGIFSWYFQRAAED